MRREKIAVGWLTAVVAVGFCPSPVRAVGPRVALKPLLRQKFDLGAARDAGTRYFDMATTFVDFGLDGKKGDKKTLRVKLKCVSVGDAEGAGDQYTCKRFTYEKPDGTLVSLPALDGWTYTFKKTTSELDENGWVFGIDHTKFEGLKDSDGEALEAIDSYLIYNTFIDFHAFCDDFATPVADGKGIQDLAKIGQKIVHASAHSKPPVDLGGTIKKGSYFKNGEITLAFKAVSLVGRTPCAVVEFDSGASSFKMLIEPMAGMEVKTVGSSHYFGDIHLDLKSKWPRRVDMREWVISESRVPMPGKKKPTKMHSVTERQTVIKAVKKKAYAKD